ncbi:hypothetical protein K432DRAFT_394837 [Lepidopterella palustris CBS 459.81]|uniref:Uncharacterized protein n=1 Tax=Lepidopterella palustris CBS 459.81 TaxID=1314670 RepID=A0A8E2E6Q7_9PEZI|nr:hypothetical protein K432DRAFT_394837 [Lepidopterella palustris CBS 459.81]
MFLTCGSVGDILGVASLVRELIVTLNESRGASADYQQMLCEQRENSVAESFTAHFQAQQCRQYITSFFEKIQKYDQCLCKGGSQNAVRDVYWKLHYRVTHKDWVEQFHREIQLQIGLINALICAEA